MPQFHFLPHLLRIGTLGPWLTALSFKVDSDGVLDYDRNVCEFGGIRRGCNHDSDNLPHWHSTPFITIRQGQHTGECSSWLLMMAFNLERIEPPLAGFNRTLLVLYYYTYRNVPLYRVGLNPLAASLLGKHNPRVFRKRGHSSVEPQKKDGESIGY